MFLDARRTRDPCPYSEAAESDPLTKYPVAKGVGGRIFKTKAKLNCNLNAMLKIAQYRAAAQQSYRMLTSTTFNEADTSPSSEKVDYIR